MIQQLHTGVMKRIDIPPEFLEIELSCSDPNVLERLSPEQKGQIKAALADYSRLRSIPVKDLEWYLLKSFGGPNPIRIRPRPAKIMGARP